MVNSSQGNSTAFPAAVVALLIVAVVLAGCGRAEKKEALPGVNELKQEAIQASREANLKMIDSAVKIYSANTGEYPTDIEQLVPEYLQQVPTDEGGGIYYLKMEGGVPEAAVR